MRQLPVSLCALVAAFGCVRGADASTPLAFSVDLFAPCTATGCGFAVHPTDISLNGVASAFSYAAGTGGASGAYVATVNLNSPVVCDEIASSTLMGAITNQRFAPTFTNASPGGLLEFNGGGASIVDIGQLAYEGSNPAGVAASYSNYGPTSPPQVICYQINPISGGPEAIAPGPNGIFAASFEDAHLVSEPWVSVQTVYSPQGTQRRGGQPDGITPTNAMGYVVEIHNAKATAQNPNGANNWHLDLGYDFNFFDPLNNGGTAPEWCILNSTIPQPGPINGSATCNNVGSTHLFSQADVQSGSSSIYIYVQSVSSAAASGAWATLSATQFPAVAAIFPPYSTYPQRFDDKVAVASSNNLPTLNIGSIVCNNDLTSTSCTILNQDGQAIPTVLNLVNTITAGTVAVDPLAYVVDPTSDSTLPANAATDALTVSHVSCSDPNGILVGTVNGINTGLAFPASIGSPNGGALALGFSFKPSGLGSPYISGTANCTATFSTPTLNAGGYSPQLSITNSFTVTMR